MQFGQWVKAKRERMRMSQETLGRMINSQASYVSDVENEKLNPTLPKAAALCAALGAKLSTALRQCGM